MKLLPHKVVAEFTHAGQRIKPPGEWTPPTQKVAEKLIGAQCLRPPRSGSGAAASSGATEEQPGSGASEETPPPAGDGEASKQPGSGAGASPGKTEEQPSSSSTEKKTSKRRRGRRGG